MKRFAAEFEEMLSHNKVFLTANGPIHRNTNDTKSEQAKVEMVENRQEMEVDTDYELDDATCNFLKKPGHIYHLYMHSNGKKYFSLISPEEWGKAPHKYIGSWKYQKDSTWIHITPYIS